MRARIDVSEVEAKTKIRAKYLRAIENEEWDLLPGAVYAKSFLRTYGDYLGLDSRMLVDEFKRRYERPAEHEPRPVAALGGERGRRPERARIPSWAPIGLVIAVILLLLYVVGIVVPGGGNSPSASRQHSRHRVIRRHTATVPARTTPAVPAVATLQLVPTGTVYVCLVDGAGTKLIDERTFTVGETIPTERAAKLLLTLGNASVSMKVDGRPVPVAPSPNAIRLLITPSGVRHIPLAQPPTCP